MKKKKIIKKKRYFVIIIEIMNSDELYFNDIINVNGSGLKFNGNCIEHIVYK